LKDKISIFSRYCDPDAVVLVPEEGLPYWWGLGVRGWTSASIFCGAGGGETVNLDLS
jgi:hypothetical protein